MSRPSLVERTRALLADVANDGVDIPRALDLLAALCDELDASERRAAEVKRLRMVLGGLRSDAQRRGPQVTPWAQAPVAVCSAVIGAVDDAIGPEVTPEPSQPFCARKVTP